MSLQILFRQMDIQMAQENCGVFVGQIHVSGLDSSGKQNIVHDSMLGSVNYLYQNVQIVNDRDIFVDGFIHDQDMKPQWSKTQ
ncbi:hypothetical protein ACOJUR_12845 [Alicyclobacillus tolerans]|uniref:hypothetical protein n=1 Tax=Alicyclobacillus tolerans TaxID=90970 RepID=UPI003B78EE76